MGMFLVFLAIFAVGCWVVFGKHPPQLRLMRAFRVKVTSDSAPERRRHIAECVGREMEHEGSRYFVGCYDPTEIPGSDAALEVIRRVFANNGDDSATVEFSTPANTPSAFDEILESAPPTVRVTNNSVQVIGPECIWAPRGRSLLRDGFLTYSFQRGLPEETMEPVIRDYYVLILPGYLMVSACMGWMIYLLGVPIVVVGIVTAFAFWLLMCLQNWLSVDAGGFHPWPPKRHSDRRPS